MRLPLIHSLSERCFSAICPGATTAVKGGKIECTNSLQRAGAIVSYLPVLSFRAMRVIAGKLNGGMIDLRQGAGVMAFDAIAQASFKRLAYAVKAGAIALGLVIYAVGTALSFALSIIDFVGTLIRCAAMQEKQDAIQGSIEIQASPDAVWSYASDNKKAHDWSVYFDHITSTQAFYPRTGDPIPEGQIGATRRCFRRSDETGIYWDEVITKLHPSGPRRHRQINTYNLQGFGIPLAKNTRYVVNQRYVDKGTCVRMSFDTYLQPTKGFFNRLVAPLTKMGFLLHRAQVKRIFDLNLDNIRCAIEQGSCYQRPHPYEP